MHREKITAARDEARRFLDRCDEALEEMGGAERLDAGKYSGALRRSSIDLTRSLANLRRPGW